CRILTRLLPYQAACERVGRGLPERQSGRAGESLIGRSLIRVQELIGREFVVVDDPAAMLVVPEVVERRGIGRLIDRIVIVAVQEQLKSRNLECRDQETVVLTRSPRVCVLLRSGRGDSDFSAAPEPLR